MDTVTGRTTFPQTPAGNSTDDTMDRLVRGAHETVDRAAAKAAPVLEQVKGSVSQASDAVHERANQIGQLSEELTGSFRSTVREHPLAALALALAVGFIVSRISAR